MKAESTVKPISPFEILEHDGENVEVLFYENIEEMPLEEETQTYSYDHYRLIVRDRDNLSESIESNIDQWLDLAKSKETKESLGEITLEQQNRADIDYISIMTGVEL